MYNKLILISLFLVFNLNVFSQNVSIGPLIGLNYSKISNSPEAKFKAGFTGGIFLNYSTKTDFGFNGSIIYSQLGDNVGTKNTLKLNYIQAPINLVYYFGDGMREGSFRPKVFLGPYVGLLLDAKSTGLSNTETLSLLNEVDYGINIGTGFNYAIKSKTWLNVDLKYGYGLANVPKILTYQNRNLSLTVGISFPLGTYDKKTGKMK